MPMPSRLIRCARAICLALLACFAVSACDTPKPFKNAAYRMIKTTRPSASVLCLPPVPGLEADLSTPLTEEIAEALLQREYLAAAHPSCHPQGRTIRANVVTLRADSVTHDWTVGPDAAASFRYTLRPPPDTTPPARTRWARTTARDIVDGLGYQPPRHRSTRSPYMLPDGSEALSRSGTRLPATSLPPSGYSANPAAAKASAPPPIRIFVKQGTGANGEGNMLLRYAMLGYLRRAGYDVTLKAKDNAPYQVQAITTMATPRSVKGKGRLQEVLITWKITDRDGELLGSLKLGNDVPATLLPRAWRQTSDVIAASSLNGIVQVIDGTHMARQKARLQAVTP